jgi:hypothetical protein
MSKNFIVKNTFISAFRSYIELADININKITVNVNKQKQDRTLFLKSGGAYEINVKKNCIYNEKKYNTYINIENNEYYFEYFDNDIQPTNKIILSNIENDIVYCIVSKIHGTKIFIEYYTQVNDILLLKFTDIKKINYPDIEELESTCEFFINYELTSDKVIIPIFLPIMKVKNSSKKIMVVHIKNNIKKCDIIILPKEDNLINNLTININYLISHNINNINTNYTSYIVSFLYNGDKSWFTL